MKYDFNRLLVPWLREQLAAVEGANDVFSNAERVKTEYMQACGALDEVAARIRAMIDTAAAEQHLTQERLDWELAGLLGAAIDEKVATPDDLLDALSLQLASVAEAFGRTSQQAREAVERQFSIAHDRQVSEAIQAAARGDTIG